MVNGFLFLDMKILESITSFYAKDEMGKITSYINIENEVKFNPGPLKKQICFQTAGGGDCFDLIYYDRTKTRQFQLRENNLINQNFLKKMSEEFSFEITPDPIHPQFLRSTLTQKRDQYSLPLMGIVKKRDDESFFMIYAQRGTTSFEDDIIYVLGIWRVELSMSFSQALFPTH